MAGGTIWTEYAEQISGESYKCCGPGKGREVTATHDGGFHPKIYNFILRENTFYSILLTSKYYLVLKASVIFLTF